MNEKLSRRILPLLLLFLYLQFAYNNGLKLHTFAYTDFPSFYYGAKLALVEKHSPYDLDRLTELARTTEPPREHEIVAHIYPYVYPPPALLLLYPTAHMKVGMAKVALLLVNHISLLAAMGMLLVPILGFGPKQALTELLPAALIIFMLTFRGVEESIVIGQVNLPVLALLCLVWWGIKRDWPAWTLAVPLALATLFKMYPILFLLLLLIRRKNLAAILTVSFIAAIWAVSFIVLPHVYWHDWITKTLPTSGYFGSPMDMFPPTLSRNISIAGFMARLFLPLRLFMEVSRPFYGHAIFPHPALGKKLTVAVISLVVLITAGISYLSVRRSARTNADPGKLLNLDFSAFLILTFLVAPLGWEHHLAYIAPACIVAILALIENPARSRALVGLMIASIFVIALPAAVGNFNLPRIPMVIAVSLKLYVVLILWIFLLAEMWRSSRTAALTSYPVTTETVKMT